MKKIFLVMLCMIIVAGFVACGSNDMPGESEAEKGNSNVQTEKKDIPSDNMIRKDLEEALLAENEHAKLSDFEVVKSLTGEGSYEVTLSVTANTKYVDWTYEADMTYRKYDQGWMVDSVAWITEKYIVVSIPECESMKEQVEKWLLSSNHSSLENLTPIENYHIFSVEVDEYDRITFEWEKIIQYKHGNSCVGYISYWKYDPQNDSWMIEKCEDSNDGILGYSIDKMYNYVEFDAVDFSGEWESITISKFSWNTFDLDWGEGVLHFSRVRSNNDDTRTYVSDCGNYYVGIGLNVDFTQIVVYKSGRTINILAGVQISQELPLLEIE